MSKNIDKRLWGVLGKQQTYFSPQKQVQGKTKTPLNSNAFDSWDVKRSRFKRVDGYENAIQQGGVVPQVSSTPIVSTPTPTPSITPTLTITPSITPTSSSLPADCVWNTTDELWNTNPNLWNDCQNAPVASPTPSITPTSTLTPTPSITPTLTITPSITPSITPTTTITPTPSSTPAPFSPNQISNLQYWFDAASGSSVSSWTNYGLLGGSITQGTATFQPEVKTNTTLGSWTGTSMRFLSRDNMVGTFTNTSFSAYTTFLIAKYITSTLTVQAGYYLYSGANVNQVFYNAFNSSGNVRSRYYAGDGYYEMTPVANQEILLEASGTTSGVRVWLNDTEETRDGAFTLYGPVVSAQVGIDPGGAISNEIQVVEILTYNKVLDTTEFQQVEDYLKTKYQYSSW